MNRRIIKKEYKDSSKRVLETIADDGNQIAIEYAYYLGIWKKHRPRKLAYTPFIWNDDFIASRKKKYHEAGQLDMEFETRLYDKSLIWWTDPRFPVADDLHGLEESPVARALCQLGIEKYEQLTTMAKLERLFNENLLKLSREEMAKLSRAEFVKLKSEELAKLSKDEQTKLREEAQAKLDNENPLQVKEGSLCLGNWLHLNINPAPPRGWKIHISARPSTAQKVLDIVLPILKESSKKYESNAYKKLVYKILVSIPEMRTFYNAARFGDSPLSQRGKFIAIYPRSDQEANFIATEIDKAFKENKLVREDFIYVSGDFQVGHSGGIYARFCHYGGFEGDKRGFPYIPLESLKIHAHDLGKEYNDYEHPFAVLKLRHRGVELPMKLSEIAGTIRYDYNFELLPVPYEKSYSPNYINCNNRMGIRSDLYTDNAPSPFVGCYNLL
ncbi:hypothetical protein FACS189449_02940 [Alphaproteobacteria bacterium]|nr:hypothetical protein FACS189449_02940 [Alphaproteobacteria bacterium]